MHCPICRNTALKVAVVFTGDVYCDFSDDGDFRVLDEVALDSAFSDDGDCCCPNCGWKGRVEQTRSTVAEPVSDSPNTPFTEKQMERLRVQISTFSGPSRQVAERLWNEVRRLNRMLEAVARLGNDSASTDTAIG